MLNKKGVSLVAVLLFMLVATIASTATYKWLSSAQFTSAGRLKLLEAQQSSRAGLDAVRAWMTFHANDVGAILHQYYAGDKNPINLNKTIAEFASSKQEYSVWLTGVDTETSPYKLKITSVGKSRDGTKYIEHSILAVDGLYQVRVPEKNAKSADFKEAFFGGGSTIALDVSSAIINGDLDIISTFNSTSFFMVTGNLKVNSSTQANDLYVAGSVEGCNDLQVQGNAYIGDYFYAPGNSSFLKGLYVGNGIDFTQGGCMFASFKSGDLTVEGDISIPLAMTPVKMEINGNLVTLNNGKIKFPKHGECTNGFCHDQQYEFSAKGNVYLDGGVNDGSHRSMGFVGSNVQLGSDGTQVYVGSNLYLVDFTNVVGLSYTDMYSSTPTDGANRWKLCENQWTLKSIAHSFCSDFDEKDNTIFLRIRGEKVSSANPSTWKADRLEEYAKKITTEPSEGCGTAPHVPDPLQFNTSILEGSYVHSNANRLECTMENGVWANQWMENLWTTTSGVVWSQINTCRSLANTQNLYMGEWYVIKLEGNRSIAYDNSTVLDGNYIIIAELEQVVQEQKDWATGQTKKIPQNTIYLPPTTSTSNVIIYVPSGHMINIQLEPGEYHNYFIFSESDLNFNQNDKRKINGSLYMSDCHKMTSVNTVEVSYNSALMDFVSSSEILCANDGTKKCGSSSGGSTSGGGTSTSVNGEMDEFFVGNAPQINISLESQYKNKETDPETLGADKTSEVEPSIMILPRVIYMTEDPIGTLSDYYNLINLNGADESKNSASVSCSNGFPTTSVLFDGEHTLNKNYSPYSCEYNSKYGKIPFWIEVNGRTEETPSIHLQTEYQEIHPGNITPTMVNLVVPKSSRTNMSIDVYVSDFPDKWHIVPQDNVHKRNIGATFATGNGEVYTVSISTDGVIPLFAVSAETGATSKTVDFHLIPPNEGCNIGYPGTESVMVTGSAIVKRVDIDESYCKQDQVVKSSNGDEVDCLTIAKRPNCGSDLQKGEWIYPYCFPSQTEMVNERWTCGTNTSIYLQAANVSEYCDAFILDTITTPGNETYELHASLKRKPHILNVNIAGEDVGSDVRTIVKSSTTGSDYTTNVTCKDIDDKHKECYVYSGDYIQITYNKGESTFSYWRCDAGDCIDHPVRSSSEFEMLVSSAPISSVTAHFNDRDEHCFYDNFNSRENSRNKVNEEFKAFCPSSTYRNCIDKCASGETNCSAGDDYRASHEANWRMVYANKYNLACSKKIGMVCVKYSKSSPSNVAPQISGGTISAPRGGIFSDYSPTVLLNTVKAGFDGEATVMMRIPIIVKDVIEKMLGEHYYDDGIILRSDENATKYISLNIYGNLLKRATARVCYVTSQEVENTGDCMEGFFQTKHGSEYVPITAATLITVKANIHGTTLDVEIDYNFGKNGSYDAGTISFDLTRLPETLQNKVGQEYIGLKLSNDDIVYSDFTWSSETYANECWDTPQIYCSFRNSYIGGWVPKNEPVTPWYAVSSWFTANNCPDATFHYNGCDFSSSYNYGDPLTNGSGRCTKSSDIGPFWRLGDKVESEVYTFSEEGGHGYYWSDKINYAGFVQLQETGNAKDASVRIICNQKTYTASCGEFNVGEIESCTKHETILDHEVSCNADEECLVWVANDAIMNVRDATLAIVVEDLDDGEVSVELLDNTSTVNAIGNRSKVSKFTGNGTKYINIGDILDAYGFNPQKFRGLSLKSSVPFKIKRIMSACSNALGISQCGAEFNGAEWILSANITNPRNASGCVVTDADKNVLYEGDCPSKGTNFSISTNVYQELQDKNVDSKDFVFKIEVTPKDADVDPPFCVTESQTVHKQKLWCDVSSTSINAGDDVPAFKFYAANCPSAGCMVHVKLENEVWSDDLTYKKLCTSTSESCEYSVWSPEIFNAVGENTYTYTATLATGESCSKSFEVTGSSDNAKATKCYLDGTTFKADIEAPESGSKVKLYYTDPIGNILGTDQIIMKGEATYEQSLSGLAISGSYVLALYIDGKQACDAIPYPTSTPTNPGGSGSTTDPDDDELDECDCKCKSGCDNLILSGVNNKVATPQPGCYFTTGDYSLPTKPRPAIHVYYGAEIYVNGELVNGSAQIYDRHDETGAVGNMSDKKIDGGFYVEVKKWFEGSGNELLFHGGTPKCKGSGGSGSGSTEPVTPVTVPVSIKCSETVTEVNNGDDLTITPIRVEGCDGGCQYSVSGSSLKDDTYSYRNGSVGVVTVNGNANEEKSYELTVTNMDGNSDKCTIKAKVKVPASATSASCTYSATTLYTGSEFTITAKNINPAQTVSLTYIVDGITEESNLSYWAPNNYSKKTTFSTAGPHVVELKIENNSVCHQQIMVEDLPANVFDVNGEKELGPGTWDLISCYNATGSKTLQFATGSSSDCLNWISPNPGSWSNGPWNTCNGQVHVSFPIRITVPSGEYVKVSGCW